MLTWSGNRSHSTRLVTRAPASPPAPRPGAGAGSRRPSRSAPAQAQPHRPAACGRPARTCRGDSAPSRSRPRRASGRQRRPPPKVVGEHPHLDRAPRPAASCCTTSATAVCIGCAPPAGEREREQGQPRRRPCYQGARATAIWAATSTTTPRRPPPRAVGAPRRASVPRRAPAAGRARPGPAPARPSTTSCPSSIPTLKPSSGTAIEPTNRLVQVVGEPGAVHQPEDAGEHRPVARRRAARAPAGGPGCSRCRSPRS